MSRKHFSLFAAFGLFMTSIWIAMSRPVMLCACCPFTVLPIGSWPNSQSKIRNLCFQSSCSMILAWGNLRPYTITTTGFPRRAMLKNKHKPSLNHWSIEHESLTVDALSIHHISISGCAALGLSSQHCKQHLITRIKFKQPTAQLQKWSNSNQRSYPQADSSQPQNSNHDPLRTLSPRHNSNYISTSWYLVVLISSCSFNKFTKQYQTSQQNHWCVCGDPSLLHCCQWRRCTCQPCLSNAMTIRLSTNSRDTLLISICIQKSLGHAIHRPTSWCLFWSRSWQRSWTRMLRSAKTASIDRWLIATNPVNTSVGKLTRLNSWRRLSCKLTYMDRSSSKCHACRSQQTH